MLQRHPSSWSHISAGFVFQPSSSGPEAFSTAQHSKPFAGGEANDWGLARVQDWGCSWLN